MEHGKVEIGAEILLRIGREFGKRLNGCRRERGSVSSNLCLDLSRGRIRLQAGAEHLISKRSGSIAARAFAGATLFCSRKRLPAPAPWVPQTVHRRFCTHRQAGRREAAGNGDCRYPQQVKWCGVANTQRIPETADRFDPIQDLYREQG